MSWGYFLTIATFAEIYAILILGLNIVAGCAKQISLGHAAFFAVGAYTQAMLVTKLGLSFWSALPLAVLISAFIGIILGLPSLRVGHDFLVLVTIGLNFVVMAIFEYFDFFGGPMGIIGLRMPTIFGWKIDVLGYFLLVLCFLLICIGITTYFFKTWAKLAMAALGEDEMAASVMGINIAVFKIYAFAISSAFAGIAGALWAHYVGSIFPRNFPFELSVLFLSMLIFGGMGTIKGALFGAIFLYILPEMFRFIQEYRMLIYGLTLAFMVVLQPDGILGKGGIVEQLATFFVKYGEKEL